MFRRIVCAASLSLSCEAALAGNLGVRGAVFPVTEPDLFAEIAAKFAALEAAGDVDAVNRHLKERAISGAERPKPVPGIGRTVEPRSFHFDPTVTLKEDILTPDGRVIGVAGTRFNPLDVTPMRQRMIFFDGDDAQQVLWARAELTRGDGPVSAILVAGPVLDLTRQWHTQVYFDQGGQLTGTFGITRVPAIVSRDGNLLRIEEVLP